jgi:hypothetical protein
MTINRLEKEDYFFEELNYNKTLKKWSSLKNYYSILEYNNESIFFFKDKKLNILNNNNDSIDIESLEFLSSLISSYPENLSENFVKNFIIYSINGSKKIYDTKKKGYFINKLDKFLQNTLNIESPTIDKFKESNRKIINFTRGKTPYFEKDIKISKIEGNDLIGLMYFSFKIYKINKTSEARKISKLSLDSANMKNNKDFFHINELFKLYDNLTILNKEDNNSLNTKKLLILIDIFKIIFKCINFIKNSSSTIKEDFISFIIKTIFNDIESITTKTIYSMSNSSISTIRIKGYIDYIKIHLKESLDDNNYIKVEWNSEIENLINELRKGIENDNSDNDKYEIDKRNFSKFNINYDGTYCEQPNWDRNIKSYTDILEIEKNSAEVWITVSNINNLANIMGKRHINEINKNSTLGKKYNIFYKNGVNNVFKENKNLSLYKLDILENIFIPFEYTILIYNPNDIQNLSGFYLGLFEEFNKDSYEKFYISLYYKNLIKLSDFLIENVN